MSKNRQTKRAKNKCGTSCVRSKQWQVLEGGGGYFHRIIEGRGYDFPPFGGGAEAASPMVSMTPGGMRPVDWSAWGRMSHTKGLSTPAHHTVHFTRRTAVRVRTAISFITGKVHTDQAFTRTNQNVHSAISIHHLIGFLSHTYFFISFLGGGGRG